MTNLSLQTTAPTTYVLSLTDASMDSDTIKLLQAEYTEICVTISVVALPLYEYLITVNQEIELVWRRKTRFSLPSILLVSTRICMAANAILTVVAPSTCTGLGIADILQQILDCAGFIQVSLFSALRVSALYNRNMTLFGFVLALGLVPVGTNIFGQTRTTYIQEPGACLLISNVSDALNRELTLITRIPVIVADFLVLMLTWAKTYKQILLLGGSGISTPLSTCLARDGALYFLTLLTVNILQMVTFRTHVGAPVAIISTVLPSILVNRFVLNLRQTGAGPDLSDSVALDRFVMSGAPRFQLSNQAVGSMGEPLEHGGSAVPDEEEDETQEENVEVDGHSLQREEGRGAQELSAEASGSGVVSV